MAVDIKAKVNALTNAVKAVKLPVLAGPNFAGGLTKTKSALDAVADRIKVSYLIYLALILLPVVVGLGAYYGIINSQAQFEAANLPENQLGRRGVNFTVDDFVKYAGRGEKEIAALFIEAGMPLDSYRKNDGFTPLHAAAAYGRTAVVRQLADKGADINVRDKDGQTPLMKAVWNSHADVVAALLQKGANITVSDAQGNNIITMAKSRNDRKVLDILVKAGVQDLKEVLEKVAPAAKQTDKKQNPDAAKQMPQIAKNVSAPASRAGSVKPTIAAAAPPGEFVLAAGYAGSIKVGDSVESLYQRFGTQAVFAGEEYFGGRTYKVLKINDQGTGLPSLTAFVAQVKDGQEQIITAIRLFDKRYKTAGGIGVEATLGDLRQGGGISSIEYTDSLYAVAQSSRMRYELDISAEAVPVVWLNGGDTNSLPDNMKIRSIFLF
ncbi:ankyrin repeat domain-containing protein [Sporomusa sp.]|uniref:ankyrin repeat domain-containing protein n=1 Tax=Sporomusa sp. TaxID=2078658 RepID=UPI002BA1CF49|nr:ankyrin repeat domain-containing protein [Sporomusa sp.]HWR06469.1 ankyrin repeat domain-containing protein [Sporomusa sp.]